MLLNKLIPNKSSTIVFFGLLIVLSLVCQQPLNRSVGSWEMSISDENSIALEINEDGSISMLFINDNNTIKNHGIWAQNDEQKNRINIFIQVSQEGIHNSYMTTLFYFDLETPNIAIFRYGINNQLNGTMRRVGSLITKESFQL